MEGDLSQKLVISAALAGAFTRKEQNPAVPYTADEFGEEAKKCYEAGAAIVHIHARNPEKGFPGSREHPENSRSVCQFLHSVLLGKAASLLRVDQNISTCRNK